MLICFLKQITDHGKFFPGTWNRETDTERFFYTQVLVALPSAHLSASIFAPMLTSASDVFGRSMSTIWITRPWFKWASKQVFHSGYRVRFFCTSCVPLPDILAEKETLYSYDQNTSAHHYPTWWHPIGSLKK